jgi:hypothetical protein
MRGFGTKHDNWEFERGKLATCGASFPLSFQCSAWDPLGAPGTASRGKQQDLQAPSFIILQLRLPSNNVHHVEDWQVHRHDHSTHDHAEEEDHDRFQKSEKA